MIQFTVPGQPRGWGRARLGRSTSGKPIHFVDRQTASYENLVKLSAQAAMRGAAPLQGPVSVDVRVMLAPAASASRAKLSAMLNGSDLPAKKPDLDNIVKGLLDGLNKIAFVDDAQVVRLTACKIYSETPGVDVTIKAVAA